MELYNVIEQHQDAIELLQELLQEEPYNLDEIYDGYAAVHRVYRRPNNIALLRFLLNHGADPNVQDPSGNTLAHYAAWENDITLLELLQSEGADFSITNNQGNTPLDRTAELHNREAYSFLAPLSQQSILERIALAIKFEHFDNLKDHLNDILNIPTKYGLAGHIACRIGNLRIITLLEERGCNLSLSSEDGRNALEEACQSKYINEANSTDRVTLLTYLMDRVGIRPTSTALYNASHCPNLEFLRLLLNNGADSNSLGSVLLDIINQNYIEDTQMEAINLLLLRGADILMCDRYVGNSLHLAAERGHKEVVKPLLSHARDRDPLINQLLVPSPPEIPIFGGMYAFEIAESRNHSEIAETIRKCFDQLQH